MDQNPTNQNQEIDLVYIYRAFGNMLTRIGLAFYDFIMLLKRNIFFIIAILIIGVGLGYYLDTKQEKVLRHDFIVIPNFGSTDFLYETFETNSFITTSLNKKDWLQLREVKKVRIEPIEDVYNLLKTNDQAEELFKTVTERGGDLSSFITEKSTLKNYKYHMLSIYTSGIEDPEEITKSFFEQINAQPYYVEKQKIAAVQNQVRKIETLRSLEQMNNLLDNFGVASNLNDSKGVSINTFPEVENLFYRKNNILNDLAMLDEEIFEQQKVVYIAGSIMNIQDEKIWNKNLLVIPFVLFIFFFGSLWMISFMKKYKIIKESSN